MKRINPSGIIIAFLVVALFTSPVLADWDPSDSYKMHYPQLPNATGWVVKCTDLNPGPTTLGDDWQCTETGPVTDIHIWGSFSGDYFNPPFRLEIWTDNRSGPNNKPGTLLWQRNFTSDEYTVRWNETGPQGWYDPVNSWFVWPLELQNRTYQYNFYIAPSEAFIQEEGSIYWLVVSANWPVVQGIFGWKTSSTHFEDDAVFWNESIGGWSELRDPITNESLDLAFVITGEPASPVPALTSTALVALVIVLSVVLALNISIRKRKRG